MEFVNGGPIKNYAVNNTLSQNQLLTLFREACVAIGYAHPLEVGRLFEAIGRFAAMDRLAAHLHDTQAMGLANSVAAISAGVRVIDSSVGGLGGCPFAPGASGNLVTEDLVLMLNSMGLKTGIDLEALLKVRNAQVLEAQP